LANLVSINTLAHRSIA